MNKDFRVIEDNERYSLLRIQVGGGMSADDSVSISIDWRSRGDEFYQSPLHFYWSRNGYSSENLRVSKSSFQGVVEVEDPDNKNLIYYFRGGNH